MTFSKLKKNLNKLLSKVTNKRFLQKNKYVILLSVFVLAYMKYTTKLVPKKIINMVTTLPGKMIAVCVILYVASKHVAYGVLLTLLFTISLCIAYKNRIEFFNSDNVGELITNLEELKQHVTKDNPEKLEQLIDNLIALIKADAESSATTASSTTDNSVEDLQKSAEAIKNLQEMEKKSEDTEPTTTSKASGVSDAAEKIKELLGQTSTTTTSA